ncbi:MAG TPA: response regulator [Candidatus Omnitrophota bacterium]|nr:response regulator [Candidatus Omnitrophota bacterium]HSA30742.1 response regulator [Candidatus Omnitrophota bacterium]
MAKKKILVVDDQRDMQLLLKKWLEAAGYEVIQAEDGEPGLWMVIEHRPDLVLTDVVMPNMNGIEFVRRLRGVDGGEAVPVIVTSSRPLMVNCFEEGAIEGFFAKPIDREGLLKKIAEIFDRQEVLKDLEAIKKRDEAHPSISAPRGPGRKQYVCKRCGKALDDPDEHCPHCGCAESLIREVFD